MSWLQLGSITGTKPMPSERQNAAIEMAKFPEEDSTTVVSVVISPRSMAPLRIQNAERSLELPFGLQYSSLA